MSGAPVDWKGLFEWSIKHQDGTKSRAHGDEIKPMSEEDRKWCVVCACSSSNREFEHAGAEHKSVAMLTMLVNEKEHDTSNPLEED